MYVVKDTLYIFFGDNPVGNVLSPFDHFWQPKEDVEGLISRIKSRLCEICQKGFCESKSFTS
jgi:hypothetical protein